MNRLPKRAIFAIIGSVVAVCILGYTRWRYKKEAAKQRRKKKEGSVNIGAIFGMDIGGTLTKLVYYERKSIKEIAKEHEEKLKSSLSMKRATSFSHLDTPDHVEALKQFYKIMADTNVYGSTGVRDEVLSFYSNILGGRLHFVRFETRMMESAIEYMSSTNVTENIRTVGCTGGGAHKYETLFKDKLDITVLQTDELKSLVLGLQFSLANAVSECYTYRCDEDIQASPRFNRDSKEFIHKVTLPSSRKTTFPYLLVNIGSGVSVLKVTDYGVYERVSGTSIGGGTYWGLCRLFTKCQKFEDALDMAETGDATEVDMLVKDIYGGSYNANLQANMVASSFGKLVMKQDPKAGLKEEDLAIALLMMITNNIGQVAYLNAQLHGCTKLYFVGNFLRHNPISCRRLAYAINFWSKGTMEALFLEHEGYFGALGTFLMSAFGDNVNTILKDTVTNSGVEGAALPYIKVNRERANTMSHAPKSASVSPSNYARHNAENEGKRKKPSTIPIPDGPTRLKSKSFDDADSNKKGCVNIHDLTKMDDFSEFLRIDENGEDRFDYVDDNNNDCDNDVLLLALKDTKLL